MNIRLLLVFVTLLVLPGLAKAQLPELINNSDFRADAQAAVDSIYNFNSQAADALLEPWKNQYPEHPLWILTDGIQLWWQILSDLENESRDDEFFEQMKRADYEASRLLQQDRGHADGLIIKAISNGYVARQYANREEWVWSVTEGREALRAYNYLLEQQSDLADLKLAEGLKLYYSAHIPEAYPITKTVSWALPDGNKQEGLRLLNEAAEEAIFAQAEAVYFLGNISFFYEDNYRDAIRYFNLLYERYPRNNFYVRIYVKSLFRQKNYETALNVIEKSLQRWREYDYPFLHVLEEELLTWKGRILTRSGRTAEGIDSFKSALEAGKNLPNADQRLFRATAAYHLGRLYYQSGDYEQARNHLQQVASWDGDYRDQADRLLDEIRKKSD